MEEEDGICQKTRDFICACGKNYLSYAALFTHIKQKHDGKAPGPIVRPRSQRKRGRPRKNQFSDNQIKNFDLDATKNRISIINEINNNNININNNNNIISFENKRKKAAELLGCGQFKGFHSYSPEMHCFIKGKPSKQPLKKLGFKRYISETEKPQIKAHKDETFSENEVVAQLNSGRSTPVQNDDVANTDKSCLYNFVIKHLKTLFFGYQPSSQEQRCNQIIEILDWIGQEVSEGKDKIKIKPNNPINQTTIENGLKNFIKQLQRHLQANQLKQVSFLLSLFYEHVQYDIGKPINSMSLGMTLTNSTKYIASFLNNYLPTKINQLQIGCLHAFKEHNPTNIMFAFCNWVTVLGIQESLNANNIYSKPQPKIQVFSFVNGKEFEKSQSEEEIKFQEINQVFDQLQRSTHVSTQKNKYQNKNGQIQYDDSNQQESINNESQSIERSSQNLRDGYKHNQLNVLLENS